MIRHKEEVEEPRPASVVEREAPGGLAATRNAVAIGAADWLCLAAAPTFAVMALLTGVFGAGEGMRCAGMRDASPPNGMVTMYVLMSAFHLVPWLKLISSRRRGAHPPWRGVAQPEFKST
jgi:hypothetical protein